MGEVLVFGESPRYRKIMEDLCALQRAIAADLDRSDHEASHEKSLRFHAVSRCVLDGDLDGARAMLTSKTKLFRARAREEARTARVIRFDQE